MRPLRIQYRTFESVGHYKMPSSFSYTNREHPATPQHLPLQQLTLRGAGAAAGQVGLVGASTAAARSMSPPSSRPAPARLLERGRPGDDDEGDSR